MTVHSLHAAAGPAASDVYDQLSRELALAAAAPFDRAARAEAAMQMIANIRDFLVADLSPAGEALLDEAIAELMDHSPDAPRPRQGLSC